MQNCWEFMRCGCEDRCPAASATHLDGVHDGRNAGRVCWLVAGSSCAGPVDRPHKRASDCTECVFYQKVLKEEYLTRRFGVSVTPDV